MARRKRKHGKLMRLNDIFKGHFVDMGDQIYYMLDDDPVHRVRVYGVVVDRYDSPESVERSYTYLTIDDGSNTIRLKLWSRSYPQDDGTIYDPLTMFDGIEVGDIVDVLGRVREYEHEYFIIPDSINSDLDIEWEMHRRSKLIENDIEQLGLQDEPFNPKNSEVQKKESGLHEKILELFSEDPEKNTIEKIADRSEKSYNQVETVLKELHFDGVIIEVREGMYSRLDDV